MSRLVAINLEKTKLENQKSQLESTLKSVKAQYRDALIDNTVEALIEIQQTEGTITEMELIVHLSNLAADLRNLYE
ncbi:putative nucleic acid-binding Zn-ribbon protein [Paenibacillus sp. LBL]|uniref:hypothetical protein n=1 Tax=Paenibacillus sp. LBL TaxID=2940563 RepID=UPI002472FE6F|nr:hypothetical protein [Paenibacillus sp. LBL]MDH6674358.1 putative nucleic acid-binding Zn-ribbon protein [Paenibacillus sp. LBL]